MTSLADIRARLTEQENKSSGKYPKSDGAIYPHWNMDGGTNCSIRFLPDGDPNNSFFWVERQVIKLPFNGVKGDPSKTGPVTVQVPCVEMFGDNCPVLAEVRPWYKDETLKTLAGKYWKKRSYLFQGFVHQNPIGDDETPANPIRRFVISPQIFSTIKDSLMDPEMEELPTDYMRGLDFNVKKNTSGQYADYSTSNWARKESALTEVEQAAIEANGLFNLADFLPNKPSDSELRIIKEMFEASVDGHAYDLEKWGAYYRPYGVQAPEGATQTSSEAAPVATPVVKTTSTPEVAAAEAVDPGTSPDKAQDILAMIRARQTSE